MKKLFLQIAPRYGNLALASLTSYGRFPKRKGVLYVNIIKRVDEIRYSLEILKADACINFVINTYIFSFHELRMHEFPIYDTGSQRSS